MVGKIIPPGGSLNTEFRMDTAGREGTNTQRVEVKLSDGSSQIFELSAHIERVLEIEGYPGLFLTRVGEVKPVGITAKWLKPGGRITGAEFSGAGVPMDWRPLPDGGAEVTFHPETLPAGRRWQGKLSLKTDYPGLPEYPREIGGLVKGRIAWEPASWSAGLIFSTGAGSAIEKDVILSAAVPFTVTGVDWGSVPGLSGSVERINDKETRVRLRLDRAVFLAAQKPGRHVIRKSIAIRHDLAGEGPVEIVFLGAVEK